MKSICLIFLSVVVFFSCHQEEGHVYVDVGICVTIENSAGMDLLNPQNANYIEPRDIRIYQRKDGILSISDSRFRVVPPDGSPNGLGDKYTLDFFCVPDTNVIEIAKRGEIEIVTEIIARGGFVVISKIWYQGDLVWPIQDRPKWVRVILN